MIKPADFCHLHTHSIYSKYDGFSKIKELIDRVKLHGQTAIGLTDHGTVAGAIKFIQTCRAEGVKPLMGIETYLSKNRLSRTNKEQPDKKRGNHHLCLFAKNYTGYKNLCTLAQRANIEGYYYAPRIDMELLDQFHEGIVCTSGCLSGVINWNLSIERYEKAKKAATIFKDIFKDDFYLEMMFHGLEVQARIIPDIQRLSKELDIPVIITQDSHYLKKEDAKYQELVVCMSNNRCVKDTSRKPFPYKEFYLKSTEEMLEVFKTVPRYLKNTMEIANKCDLSDLKFGGMNLPKFVVPNGMTSYLYLEMLAWQGLEQKGKHKDNRYVERLSQELSDVKLVVDTKNYDFPTYFLIVSDIINFAHSKKIPLDIRGSGNGSLLLYVLGVSKVDPIKYGTMWTRFLGFDDLVYLCDEDFC